MQLLHILPAVLALLQREGRGTYEALQDAFGFDAAFLEKVRRELLFKRVAIDEEGIGLKLEPNDVDILIVVGDDFRDQDDDPEVFPMFDHQRAQRELGASIFVVRLAFLLGETVDDFMAHWQITRDRSRRGIVEVLGEEAV